MNKFLVVSVLALLTLTGAGCDTIDRVSGNQSVEPVKKANAAQEDNFSKKKECAKYLDAFSTKYKAEASEVSGISKQWVCFSEERNSCVGFNEVFVLPKDGKGGYKEYSIEDLLTNENVAYNFAALDKREEYEPQKLKQIELVKCVK